MIGETPLFCSRQLWGILARLLQPKGVAGNRGLYPRDGMRCASNLGVYLSQSSQLTMRMWKASCSSRKGRIMISSRENILRTVHGENPEYVPLSFTDIHYTGLFAMDAVGQPFADGSDAFGCEWIHTFEGAMNAPGFVMFDDVADWEKYVKFPDLDEIDFHELAARESAVLPIDRENRLVVTMEEGGAFMRLISFMGIENALCALMEDPEACCNFFEAYTEFKIDYNTRLIDAYAPDMIVLGEDVANAKNLFMAPEVYRDLLKPFHAAVCDAAAKRDTLVEFHCCGKCEDIIPDFVEMGVSSWQSAQVMNDLAGILDKYGNQMAVDGGWDSSGKVSFLKPEDGGDILRDETHRCLTEYKKPGFILWPLFYTDKGWVSSTASDPRTQAVVEEWEAMKWFD